MLLGLSKMTVPSKMHPRMVWKKKYSNRNIQRQKCLKDRIYRKLKDLVNRNQGKDCMNNGQERYPSIADKVKITGQ